MCHENESYPGVLFFTIEKLVNPLVHGEKSLFSVNPFCRLQGSDGVYVPVPG